MTSSIERANEEFEEFRKLNANDRRWIGALLSLKRSYVEAPERYVDAVNRSAAEFSDTLLDVTFLFGVGKKAVVWEREFKSKRIDPLSNFDVNVIGPLIEMGGQSHHLGYLLGLDAFRFLMERLFGGECRPFIPSAYAACRLHPRIGSEENRLADLEDAELFNACGYGTDDCIYFPSLTDVSSLRKENGV